MAKEARCSLCDFLISSRGKARLTQWEVAQAFGYTSPQFISNWERFVSTPPIDAIPKLANIYSISSDHLYHLIECAVVEESVEKMRFAYQQSKHLGLNIGLREL